MARRGHEQPNRDNQPEVSLFNQSSAEPADHIDDSIREPAQETAPEPPLPVEEIMTEHERRLQERAERQEAMEKANWPPGRIEQTLDKEFPDLRSSERVEEIGLQDQAAIRREARKQPGARRRPPPPRYASPRDKGAPERIVRQIRGEYGD